MDEATADRLLAEQRRYYRERAAEYGDWWFRRAGLRPRHRDCSALVRRRAGARGGARGVPAALRRPLELGPYTSFAFTRRLAALGIVGSTGSVGDALDNAMCESLLGTMQTEKLNRRRGRSVDGVRAASSMTPRYGT